MNKLIAAVAVIALMSAISSRADTTNILTKQDITIKGKLKPSKTAITGASLSGNTNAISHLDLEIISTDGTTTNEEQWIGQVVDSNITLFLQQKANADLTPNAPRVHKFVAVFVGNGQVGTSSDAVIFVNGISKGPETNQTISATVQGIWVDGTQAVTGTLKSAKKK